VLGATSTRTDGDFRPLADHAGDVSSSPLCADQTAGFVHGPFGGGHPFSGERGFTLLTTRYFGRLIVCTGIHAQWIGLVVWPCKLAHGLASGIGQEKIGWESADYALQLAVVSLDPTGRS
jgi:hypothetical protein